MRPQEREKRRKAGRAHPRRNRGTKPLDSFDIFDIIDTIEMIEIIEKTEIAHGKPPRASARPAYPRAGFGYSPRSCAARRICLKSSGKSPFRAQAM